MLGARYLANLSDDLIEFYGNLEYELKRDIFRRLHKLGRVTDATIWQTEILQQTGGLNNDIKKILSSYDVHARKILERLYNEAMTKSLKKDISYYKLASRNMTENQKQLLNATIDRLLEPDRINKTYAQQSKQFEAIYSNLMRMTATVADDAQKQFIKAANTAFLKVSTGGFSWQQAYKDAVNDLARNGLKVKSEPNKAPVVYGNKVIYSGSGKIREYSIETATRMNILTGINQAASQQTLENSLELGCDLVEVSAHIGARPKHEALQGKVYCLQGEREYKDESGNTHLAKNFYIECEFGTAGGICGINCRHSFYPYFEGMPLEYSNGELSEMSDKRVTLDNKQITPYEAEQELRLAERNIRAYKTEVMGYKMAGLTDDPQYTRAREDLGRWQENARHITNETGIRRNYINEYIGTKNGEQPRGIKPKN